LSQCRTSAQIESDQRMPRHPPHNGAHEPRGQLRADVGGTPYRRNLRLRLESARSTDMGSDSPLSARMDAQLRAAGIPADQIDRPQFFADVQALELRLAIID